MEEAGEGWAEEAGEGWVEEAILSLLSEGSGSDSPASNLSDLLDGGMGWLLAIIVCRVYFQG